MSNEMLNDIKKRATQYVDFLELPPGEPRTVVYKTFVAAFIEGAMYVSKASVHTVEKTLRAAAAEIVEEYARRGR